MWEMPNSSLSPDESILHLTPLVFSLKCISCSDLELSVRHIEAKLCTVVCGMLHTQPCSPFEGHHYLLPRIATTFNVCPLGTSGPFLNYILFVPIHSLFLGYFRALLCLTVQHSSHSNAPPRYDPFRTSNPEMAVLFFSASLVLWPISVMKYNAHY